MAEQISSEDRILSIISDVPGEPEETPSEEPQEIEAQDTETEDESPPEVEAQSGEEDGEPGGTEEEDSGDAPQEGDAKVAETLSELAEAYETDISELYKIKVPYNVDGESKNFTLSEVKDIVQDHQRIQKELETVQQMKGALEAEQKEGKTQFAERLNELASLVNVIEKQLDTDENSEEMRELKANDPGLYALKKQEITDRKNAIQQVKAEATNLFKQQEQEWSQKSQSERNEHIQREQERLHKAIPEWGDQEVAKREVAELRTFLMGQGFTDQEIANVDDHRHIVIARLAMMGNKAKNSSDAAKKRIAKLPKVVKPGQKAAKEDAETKAEKALRGQLKKSGKPQDAARLLLSRGLT